MMVTGSRHDSVPGMYACQRVIKSMGYHIDCACLDATDFYVMARDLWNMKPFIPLNNTNEGNIKKTITEDGVPICQAGHRMCY